MSSKNINICESLIGKKSSSFSCQADLDGSISDNAYEYGGGF